MEVVCIISETIALLLVLVVCKLGLSIQYSIYTIDKYFKITFPISEKYPFQEI